MRLRPALFWLLVPVQIWIAHVIGFMMHEYAHSFTAWIFHAKANPLALNYGHLRFSNLLMQGDIDENVDYDPIFAAGRGPLAALIAVAGVLIGNGLSYVISRFFYVRARRREMPAWAMFFYWLCVMSVGNFLCYVPIRTFSNHADMATAEKGLGASPWVIAIGLGVPFAVAIWHFFARIVPDAEGFLLPGVVWSQRIFLLLTTFLVFCFFGSAGLHGHGGVSHWLSVTSAYCLFPVVSILCWPRSGGRGAPLPVPPGVDGNDSVRA